MTIALPEHAFDEDRPDEMSGDDEPSCRDEILGGAGGTKSKKKKKRKAKPKRDFLMTDISTLPAEAPEEREAWEKQLVRCPTVSLPAWGLLGASHRQTLGILRTEGCRSLELLTPRLRLRQVETGDLKGIERIKTEPLVQKTQLYGAPTATDCKESFLNRYIRSSMPRLGMHYPNQLRDEYIFAITLRDPSSVELAKLSAIRVSSRIPSTEGYIGNIAIAFEMETESDHLFPRRNKVYAHPTLAYTAEAGVRGSMFYELHPQLWGKGLMSEAFEEVLRFAMEEVGCVKVVSDPTTANPASIKLCTRSGMRHTHTNTDNPYRKPQAFYEISRDEWWSRKRQDREQKGVWEGKEVCRWCMNFRRPLPAIRCRCGWARYCTRECQRADWVRKGGHQSECTA